MRQISFVFLWLLTFIMPWEGLFVLPELPTLVRFLGLLAFLSGLIGAIFSGRLKLPLALVWVALFSGWCAVSAQWSPEPEVAVVRAGTYLQLLLFVWLMCELADKPQRLKSLMRAFVLGTSMMVVNLYLGYVAHLGVPFDNEGEVRYAAAAANANGVALLCSLSILFAFHLITRREKTGFELPNWFYWGFIVAAALAALLTGSRAGAMSLGVAGLVPLGFVLFGRLQKINRKVRLGLVASAVFVAILIPVLVARSTINRIGEGWSGDTFRVRKDAWEHGLKAWVDSPFLGVGEGGYADVLGKQGERRLVAHNTVVGVLVENGLVGFTFYFLFWAIVIRRVLLMPKADRYFWLGLFACYLPHFLSGDVQYQKSWWLLGAMVLCQASQPSAADAKKRRIAPSVVPGLSLRPPRPRPS